MVQIILTLVVIVAIAAITYLLYRSRVNERPGVLNESRITIQSLGELVAKELAELCRDDDLVVTSDIHFRAVMHKKRILAKALDECIYGVEKSKAVVLSNIRFIIERELPEEADCNDVVNFEDILYADYDIQWEVLIYYIKTHHKNNPMRYLCDKYHLSTEKEIGTRR